MGTTTIIIDTREQKPYSFPGVETQTKKLVTGDYSVAGYEDYISVERKTLDDYLGSITTRRATFFKEIRRLSLIEHACVVVEADMADIYKHEYRSGITPQAIIGTTMCIIVDFGVPVFFCGSREYAREFAERFLIRSLKWRKITNEESNDI